MQLPSLDQLKTAAAILGGAVTIASAFCAATPTPPPSSLWGRAYRWIEAAALLVGRAKEIGILPDSPGAARIAAEIEPPKAA